MIVPRWEWRAFGGSFDRVHDRFTTLVPDRVQDSDETYLLSALGDASVKVRDGLMDVKRLQEVDADGLEQWQPVMKAEFPLAAAGVRDVLAALEVSAPVLERDAYTFEQLVDELVEPHPDLRAVDVHKHREHFTVGGAMAERSEIGTADATVATIAVESEDPQLVAAAVRGLGLPLRPNVCMARGLKELVGPGA